MPPYMTGFIGHQSQKLTQWVPFTKLGMSNRALGLAGTEGVLSSLSVANGRPVILR